MAIHNNGPASLVRLNAVTVQALINTIVGTDGATLADVTATLAGLAGGDGVLAQQIAKAITGKTNPTGAELQAAFDAFVTEDELEDRLAKFLADLTGNLQTGTGGTGLTAEQVQALIDAALAGLPGVDAAAVAQIADAAVEDKIPAVIQAVIDYIAAQPGGGDTAAQLAAVAEQIAEIQGNFAQMGPAVGEAIQSAVKALPDRITLNVNGGDAPSKVTIASHNFDTPRQPVDIDFDPMFGGQVTLRGKRLLTVDDALAAAGGGIDQAAVEAVVAAATAGLRAEIDALKEQNKQLMVSLTQKSEPTLADVAGLNLPEALIYLFNNVPANDQVQAALDTKADKSAVQGVMDVLGGRKGATLVHVEQGWQSLIDYISNVEQWANATVAEVIDYVVTDFATKAELAAAATQLTTALQAMIDAIAGPGSAPSNVTDFFTELKDQIANVGTHITEYVDEAMAAGFDEKLPIILEALSQHLENTLAIFTSGTPGQVVTPAQLTQLLADIARDYATKQQVDAALAAYAKKDDSDQEIVARVISTRGILFTTTNEVLAPVDYEDYGTRVSLLPKNATSLDDAGIVVVHTDLADLVPEVGK